MRFQAALSRWVVCATYRLYMTRPNTASSDHTSRTLSPTSPCPTLYWVPYTGQFFQVAWSAQSLSAMSPCLYLAPHGNGRRSAFFSLFPFIRPSMHQSTELIKSCMDFLPFNLLDQKYDHDFCTDWNQHAAGDEGRQLWLMKNRSHSTIIEDHTKIASNVNDEKQELSSLNHCMKGRQIAWTSVFCDGTYTARTYQTCTWRPSTWLPIGRS